MNRGEGPTRVPSRSRTSRNGEPGHRGRGFGRELLRTLAAVCVERGYSRLEWSVLDWNTPSIEFYRAAGAVPMDDWTVFRLTDDALTGFAAAARE